MTRQKPILAEGGLTGKVYIVTSYTHRDNGVTIAHVKIDVTERFDEIARHRAARREEAS